MIFATQIPFLSNGSNAEMRKPIHGNCKVQRQTVFSLYVPWHIIRRKEDRGIFLDGTAKQKIYNVPRSIESGGLTVESIHPRLHYKKSIYLVTKVSNNKKYCFLNLYQDFQ